MNKKTLDVALVTLGIIAVIFIAIFLLGYKLTQNDVRSAIANNSETTDWKTYKNEKYGFEFKYLENFKIQESYKEKSYDGLSHYNLSVDAPADYQKGTDFNVARISISVSPVINNCFQSGQNLSKMSGTKVINGATFYFDPKQPYPDSVMGGQRGFYSAFVTMNDGQCYQIEKLIGYRDARGFAEPPYPPHFDESKANADFDEIISTFRLTKPSINTSTWKTYKNEKYGFEFKYPEKLGVLTNSPEGRIDCSSKAYTETNISPSIERLGVGLACDSALEMGKEFKDTLHKVTINGLEIYYFDYVSAVGYINKEAYIALPNGMYASLSHTFKVGRPDYTELSFDEFKDILSTFKFTASNTGTGWKTYKDKNYGFEVSYPANLKLETVGTSLADWRIITGNNSFHIGLTDKNEVNCNYDNADEEISDVYAFRKSSNPTRYVVMTNKEYDFEIILACMINKCSNEEYALQTKIAETFSVFGEVKSLNCAG